MRSPGAGFTFISEPSRGYMLLCTIENIYIQTMNWAFRNLRSEEWTMFWLGHTPYHARLKRDIGNQVFSQTITFTEVHEMAHPQA